MPGRAGALMPSPVSIATSAVVIANSRSGAGPLSFSSPPEQRVEEAQPN